MSTDDGIFDAAVAATYDDDHRAEGDADLSAAVSVLARFAADGTALEFAVGTGRVALPLRAIGVDISGIELSSAMVAKLREKETGPPMPVAIGDMTTTSLGSDHALVFLVYNTIDNLTSQDAQIACFQNAARHLAQGGRFVVETLVPPVQKIPFGEDKLAFARSDDHWGIDQFDLVNQTYASHHLRMTENGLRRTSVPFRYAWPAELDLMARMAGLQLESRWADWEGGAFLATSPRHISVWVKV